MSMLQSDIQTISDVMLVIIKSLVCSHYIAAGRCDEMTSFCGS